MKKNTNFTKKLHSIYQGEGIVGFLTAMLIFGVATGMFAGVLNNFLHDILGISREGRGIVEFPRELPGLLLFLIIGLLYKFSELKVMYFSLIISFLGLLGLGLFGITVGPAIVLIILWSTGEHMMMPIKNSISMHLARPGKEGLAMGGVGSVGNIGQLAGYYAVPLIFIVYRKFLPAAAESTPFRFTYLFGAAILLLGIILTSRMKNKDEHVKRQKIVFHKKFSRYYILEMFFGARKQVFLTFAPFVLIINYGVRKEYIFLNPLIGRLLEKEGDTYLPVFVAPD